MWIMFEHFYLLSAIAADPFIFAAKNTWIGLQTHNSKTLK